MVAAFQQKDGQPQEKGIDHDKGPQGQGRFHIAHVPARVVSKWNLQSANSKKGVPSVLF
jgi:hypothetical protein